MCTFWVEIGTIKPIPKGVVNMSTFEQQLSNYAELAVKVGVNIQPNQYLIY